MRIRITVEQASAFGARVFPWGEKSGSGGKTLKAGDSFVIEGENISLHGTDGDPIPGATDAGLGGGGSEG